MKIEDVKKLNIPKSPGCYLYKDDKGNIIYVGKASDLHSRVLSYWRPSADHSPAKHAMMKQIARIEWVETDSEIEALLLESNLIKKHAPQFNVIMRDDKRYAYIKVSTEEEWPRVFFARKIDKSGKYFGPFTSAEAVRETLRIIRKIWPYRSCRTMPKRACLYYAIGKCPGACEQRIDRIEYNRIIKQIILFLEGKKDQIIKNYELRIKKLVSSIKYPVSSKKIKKPNTKYIIPDTKYQDIEKEISLLKYQLNNLKNVLEHSRIIGVSEKYAADVVELAKILSLPAVPERIEGYDISNIFGKEATGSMVVFTDGEPEKGEYRKFKIQMEYSEGNDVGMLKEVLERRFKHSNVIPVTTGIQKVNCDFEPDSHLRGNDKIKKHWSLPDLIIVDGGKGQLNAALSVLKKFKLDIPVLGVSKGEGLRSAGAPDKIFFPGEKKPLELPLASPALHLIKRVRDEAHRFAIGYHRQMHRKKMFR